MTATDRRWELAALAILCLASLTAAQGCRCSFNCNECCFTKEWNWICFCWEKVPKQKMYFDNRNYYDRHGVFLEDAAKVAYMDFLEWHGYEINPKIKEKIWVTDFGLGQFTRCGMGIITWANEATHNYTGLEVLLLPGQTQPEHWYVDTAEAMPKTKTVHCRFGSVYLYGQGKPTPKIKGQVWKFLKLHTTVWHERVLKAGETAPVPQPPEKRWKQAGPTGAVLTEYSTFHDLKGMRFTNPNVQRKNID